MKSLGLIGPEQTPFYVKEPKLGAPLVTVGKSSDRIAVGINSFFLTNYLNYDENGNHRLFFNIFLYILLINNSILLYYLIL